MKLSIFLLLFSIIKSSYIKECPFKDKESLFSFYSKGILNITEPYNADTFYYCVNGNSLKGYIESSYGDEFKEETGIYVGAGINLGSINFEYLPDDSSIRRNLSGLINKKGKEAEKALKGKDIFNEYSINIFNQFVYMKYLEEFENKYKDISPNSIKISLLSFYVKFHSTTIFSKIDSLIKNKNYDEIQYYILTLNGGNYISKKLWYLTLSIPGNKINNFYYHIGIIFDSKLKEDTDITDFKKNIKNFISWNENNKYSISDSNDFILKNLNSDEAYSIFDKYVYHYIENESLKQQTNNMISYLQNEISFPDNYFQRILLLFLTEKPDLSSLDLENSKINAILYGKISENFSYNDMENIIGNNYNVILFEQLNEVYDFSSILFSIINRQINVFNVNTEINETLKIKNIITRREISYQSFKIILPDNREKERIIHLSLSHNNIDNIINNNYNVNISIFASFDNPYPDVFDNSIKNLGNNVLNSFINVNCSNSKNHFYILIFGSDLNYTLTISNCESNCSIESNGIYKYHRNITIYDKKATFSPNCSRPKCPFPLEDFYKLYSIGISNNEQSLFFSWEIYNCFFDNKFCVYFDLKDDLIDIDKGPIVGENIILKNETEFSLFKDKKIPFYLINRFYPLLGKFYSNETIKKNVENYNLYFTIEELNLINSDFLDYKKNDFLKIVPKTCLNSISSSIKLTLFLRSLSSNLIQEEINLACKKKNEEFYQKIMKNEENLNLKGLEKLLIESNFNKIKSKALISFVIGKSMLFNYEIKTILSSFSDYQVSISYYNDKENYTYLLRDFSYDNCDSVINNFITNHNFENTSYLDMNNILLQQKKLFQYYDYGFQKVIIIISKKKDSSLEYNFNYKLIEPNREIIKKIDDLGINYLHFTNVYEKSKFENKNYWLKVHQIINIKNGNSLISDIDLLINYIKIMPIPMTSLSNLILDLKQNEIITFEFKLKNDNSIEKEKKAKTPIIQNENENIKFIFDSPNINVHFSQFFPFPNDLFYDIQYEVYSSDYSKEINVKSKDLSKKFYMSIEGLENLTYLKVDIYECEDKNKCMKQIIQKYIKIGFLVGGILMFLFGIYVCLSDSIIKRQTNIFEK